MNIKTLALFIILTGLGIGAAGASDKIWVGLYHAKNSPPSADATLAPERLGHSLREVFGFKHYELVKAEEIELTHNWEQWAIPRKDFFIRVQPLERPDGEAKLVDYEIYKDGFIVAKGKYEPHKDTPLFINGPDFKNGRLIFVLEAR
jgi:hypothetical protein